MPRSSPEGTRTPHRRSRAIVLTVAAALAAGTACEERPSPDLIPSQVGADPGPEYAVALDSARTAARRAMENAYLPGVSVAVGLDGEIIWSEGFGWADLTRNTPATPFTLYPAGSISKSMTSVAVGVLRERGLIDLEAPVQTYLPDFPEKAKGAITPRHLMGHIAGLQNYGIYDALRQEHCTDLREGLSLLQDDTLRRAPGERYYYSNYGFRMVGAIVRVAANEPYVDFMRREVLDPMGMVHTVPDTALQVQPGLATPYNQRSFQTMRRSQPVDMSCTMAEGGWLSTPSDLVRLGFAMLDHTLLEEETVDLLWTPLELNGGSSTGYGLGWFVRPMRLGNDEGTTEAVGHGGATLGGRASLIIIPETRMVVATMTNVRGPRVDMQGLSGYLATYFRSPESTR